MSSEEFEFRINLIKIQNLLSDEDRKQLHFIFGDDIPRRLQSDGSIENALDTLQTLFDRLKISSSNCDYLIRALEGIERHDCAQRLLNYKRIVPDKLIECLSNEQCLRSEKLPITSAEILADFEAEDSIDVSNKFVSRNVIPIDCHTIDFKPFEDSSCPWTDEYSKSLNLQLTPRSYHIEIIRNAIQQGNTIICLRTGAGKTFIASLLIKYYFLKSQKENSAKPFFSLFLVPRKAIRLQQAKAIDEIGNMKVQICEDDQTIDKIIGDHQIIVATPQKLVNCLKKGTIQLSNIDLLVLDECHHTSGGNPYAEIMKYYTCPSRQQNQGKKPIIIGLTATISAKDATEKRDSMEMNLISLCSRLACFQISTVCDPRNIDELNKEISRPKNDPFKHVHKAQYNQFFHEYLKMFQNLIEEIKRKIDDWQVLNDHQVGSAGYIGQLILLKRKYERNGDSNNTVICDYLLLLSKRYAALYDLPFDAVIERIIGELESYHSTCETSKIISDISHERCITELKIILEKCAQNPTINSKLDCLIQLIQEHSQNKQKGLILVKTTFYAKVLYDFISNHRQVKEANDGNIQSTWIVGQNSDDYSLTIHNQQERLRKFKEDEINLLIATDIVQEGLDIPTCSYVIRYEFVSDEIGTIQSRGRVRATNGYYYLVTEQNSPNHIRELNNKYREDDMETTISQWPQMDKVMFRESVEKRMKSLIEQWEKDIKNEMKRANEMKTIGQKRGSIHCRRCNRMLGEIAWLKRRNTTYFINDKMFFENNDCKLKETFKSYQENLTIGDVFCTCGNSLGGCQRFLDRPEIGPFCALKCTQIKFTIDYQPPYIDFPQWSRNNRFDVEELEEI